MASAKREGKLTPKQACQRLAQLKTERLTWESHWRECTDYGMPNRNDINRTITPGEKRNIKLYDNTALQANELLASAMHGLLTNPDAEFFEFSTGDQDLDNDDEVRKWLQTTTTQVHNVLNGSNFQTEVHQLYLDLCCIGTGPMSIEEDDETIVRFGSRHIKEIYVAENSKGVIDEIYREFEWNARQLMDEFGPTNLTRDVMRAFEAGTNEKFKILHAIYPRNIQDPAPTPKRMKYVSQYILIKEEVELDESGFRQNPIVTPRWSKASGEVYGRSPMMNALPDAKTLNKMTETILIAAQKMTDPPLQLPDDGFIMPIKTKPGGLNYYRAGSTDRITPVFNNAQIDFGYEAMKDRRARVQDAFYVNQLQLNQGPQMTATEVIQRKDENSRILSPVLGRQQSEFLRPLIDRVFEIMMRRGLIVNIPQKLSGRVLDVQYSSVLARAQRVAEGQNITQTIQIAQPFFTMDPTVADNIDGDAAFKSIARIYNFPQEILRDQDKVQAIREGRAKAQAQQAAAAQQAQQVDTVAKAQPIVDKLDASQ